MGRRSTPVVLCPASDWQVAMGDTHRTGCSHSFYDPDVDRNRAHASTPLAAVNKKSPNDSDRKIIGGTYGVNSGECQNFRRGSCSSCRDKHWNSGTDGRIELPKFPAPCTAEQRHAGTRGPIRMALAPRHPAWIPALFKPLCTGSRGIRSSVLDFWRLTLVQPANNFPGPIPPNCARQR